MPDPRARMKGLPNLGAAIDKRIRASSNRLIQREASVAPNVPISQGGFPGGSGQGDEPVAPETWVTSVCAAGETEKLHGALVLCGEGETRITQSPSAPHFTISSPSYAATDGLVRIGDEFRTDPTVVRTSGDQIIDGVKNFSAFPQTPESAPGQDYDTANKKYVDDQVSADQLWQRSAGVLSPRHGSDALELANYVKLVLDSPTEAAIYAFVINENHPRFTVQSSGLCCWGDGSSFDTSLKRITASLLGMDQDQAFRVGEFCESVQSTSEPNVPSNGFSRLFHKADTRVYSIEPGGVVHDLSSAHKQDFPAVGSADGSQILLAYWPAAFPAWAILPADFAAAGIGSLSWPNGGGPAQFVCTCAEFDWTSAAQDGGITAGAQLALGAACRRFGATATMHARIKVNLPARFSGIYLSLNDEGNNSAASANFISNISADTWYEATLSGVDTSGWDEYLHLVLTVQGTQSAGNVGATQLQVEGLSIEQWAK